MPNTLRDLLAQNTRYRLDDPVPSEAELGECQTRRAWELPASYKEFVLLGGLNDLAFSNRVLSPAELETNRLTAHPNYLPFAANG